MPKEGYYLPRRGLISQADSAHIENARVPRSTFINQWSRKTAFDAGILIPVLVDELLPGDHMKYNLTAYIRMQTPLFPMFDTQRVDTHFFFVPARLLWDNWVKFMGEQVNPTDTINYTVPQLVTQAAGEAVGSLYDHMGIPVAGQVAASLSINALPFRAYNIIWNAWFRDENIQTAAYDHHTSDGPDDRTLYNLLRRAKSPDYFTRALPWPQKFTAPTVPLGGLAPVVGLGSQSGAPHVGPVTALETGNVGATYANYRTLNTAGVPDAMYANAAPAASGGYPLIYADLAQTAGVAINVLRQAFLVQELLERDARGGTRYVELIRSHFGVINPDFRLQRPEYIGGGQSPLNITPVAQTAPSTGVTVGALGAAGTASGTHHASYAATEHGYVLGLLSIKSDISYQQGLHKLWQRTTRYDFYFPTLAGLGEQAILVKELYATGAGDSDVFGYQARWEEYRTRYSDVTGIMRSTATGTLDAWHLAQKFTGNPALNDAFIADIPPVARVIAAGTAANGFQYLADINYQRTAIRPIPTFGTPVTLGRF